MTTGHCARENRRVARNLYQMTLISVRFSQPIYLGDRIAVVAVTSPSAAQLPADAEKDGTAQRDIEVLKQVTHLFLSNVERLREAQIGALDDVLLPVIGRAEAEALVHLSEALCTTNLAPARTVRELAFHDNPEIAAPILQNSSRLSESELIEIAMTKGQQHLLAIAGRQTLNEAVTDALMRRGDGEVSNALARNAGAKFSECGYATLVGRAEADEYLTERLGLRLDLPANLLLELITKATDIVRARFLTASRPVAQGKRPAAGAQSRPAGPKKDYTEVLSSLSALNRAGKLNDSAVNRFAVRSEHDNLIAALALKTEVDTDTIAALLESDRLYALIVACKAARLDWATAKMIIHHRPNCPPVSHKELEQGRAVFDGILLSVAQWTIRFGADRMHGKKLDLGAQAPLVPAASPPKKG